MRNRMRIAVAGAAGRLGGAVVAELSDAGHTVFGLGRADMDITNPGQVAAVTAMLQPHVIVNCSAYNAVDAAEAAVGEAYAINAHGPGVLAAAALSCGAVLVHFSTDFVFDGRASAPYGEDDDPNPLSVYGASKLAGEDEVRKTPRHYILRVESLFGGTGVNGHRATIDYMAATLGAGQTVRAAVDRVVTPTYVPDAARVTRALLDGRAAPGVYHCVNSGVATWYEVAQEVARLVGGHGGIVPVLSSALTTVAPRPQFCALSNAKLAAAGIPLPTWQSALARHFSELHAAAPVARNAAV